MGAHKAIILPCLFPWLWHGPGHGLDHGHGDAARVCAGHAPMTLTMAVVGQSAGKKPTLGLSPPLSFSIYTIHIYIYKHIYMYIYMYLRIHIYIVLYTSYYLSHSSFYPHKIVESPTKSIQRHKILDKTQNFSTTT